jgi:3-oxoacyl-[acyl-carrier protein] reductase
MKDLTNQVVVITGASRGIGAAIARQFASEKCRLVLNGRNKRDLQGVADSLNLSAGNVVTVAADITRAGGMKKIVETAIRKFERIDIFINNAGVGMAKSFKRTSEKEFDTIMRTNLKAVFYSFQHLLPRFEKQNGGHIINISSMAGKQGVPGIAAYSASKAAMNVLSEAVAGEVRNENVKISVLAPASTDTGFMTNMTGEQSRKTSRAAKKLSVTEVAEAVLFMARQNQNAWMSMADIRPLIVKK